MMDDIIDALGKVNSAGVKGRSKITPPEQKRAELIAHAKETKCKIDEEVLKDVLKVGEKKGEYYCPCMVIENIKEEKRKDFICPCKPSLKAIETKGKCHCELFYR